jgi:hypothetical protein
VALTLPALRERLALLRGAVTIAFPAGLPAHDPVRAALEGTEELAGSAAGADELDPATATLWWAGKEFVRDKAVADVVGRNEKTKIVARLQGRGAGPPAREPAVSEDERRAMMAHFFKKQEEEKALAEDDDDAYEHSRWADPRALKGALLGTGDVAWRPGGGRR